MTPDEYLDKIRSLLPGIASRAQEAETLRRIPDATVDELRGSGLWKAVQPKRWGGNEFDPRVLYQAAREIGHACGSTAWVFGILGVHPWQLALFPDEAQADVWSSDDTTLVSSTYAPVGQLSRTSGGYRLSGRWPYSSGADHCDWVFLGALDTEGEAPDLLTLLLPRADYQIIDTWHASGLKGSGTNDIVVEDAFIPAHRALSFIDMGRCECPGQARNTAAIYKLPFASVFPAAIVASGLGIAEGGIEAFREHLSARFKIAYGQAAKEDPHAQVRLARVNSMVDAAWLQLDRNMGALLAAAEQGESLSMLELARLRHDQTYGMGQAAAAVDQCFEASGGSVLRSGDRLQRAWRDVRAARQHAINDYERAAEAYGQVLLGIDVQDPMI
jgi:3-hydroxy-9,10-secoandrosta-1,3,5(10)-triene-9,17-dione monooxygenase